MPFPTDDLYFHVLEGCCYVCLFSLVDEAELCKVFTIVLLIVWAHRTYHDLDHRSALHELDL